MGDTVVYRGPIDTQELRSYLPILSSGTSIALLSSQCKGHVLLMTATGTVTLPPCESGMFISIYSTTAATVYVDPDANDRIVLDGAPGGDGKKLTSPGTAGDMVTLVCESVDGWTVTGRSGTWTMES